VPDDRIDRVKAGLAAYNDQDFDAVVELFWDDIEMERVSGLGTLRGKAEVRQSFEPDAFEYQRAKALLLKESGDTVFAACDWIGKGQGSGAEVLTRAYIVFFFDGELVRRIELHLDEPEALAAAGLSA
jgi:hypothetical protein